MPYADTIKHTLALLEILEHQTDETNPMHIGTMVSKLAALGEEYAANRDTVSRTLEKIRAMYPDKLHCVELQRMQNGERNRYTYGYWLEQPFYFREAEQKVPRQVVENVKFIRETLRRNEESNQNYQLLSFVFNGYGADGKPHPAGGVQPRNNVLPLKICAAYGNFYLIGIFKGRTELAHFRLDLMTNLEETATPKTKELADTKKFAMNRIANIDEYIHKHLYMSYETPDDRPMIMELTVLKWTDRPDASLTFLYDVFGGHWTTVNDTETTVTVKVECTRWAMEQFAWANIDRIEKIEPKEIWDDLQEKLRAKVEKYFRK